MECPHCHMEIAGSECPHCGKEVPSESRFCMYCGESLDLEFKEETGDSDGYDFDNRVLCTDGACTGIIIDGRCTECGKPLEE